MPSVGKRDERRKVPRYPVNSDSEVEEPRVHAKIKGRMTDLGLGGCYVDAIVTFPIGTEVHIRMAREDLDFEADATVVFSKPGLGMGLEFTNLTGADRRYLSKWVDELSGVERGPEIPSRTAPLDDDEAGERGELSALQKLVKVLLQRDVITQSDFEQILHEIGKQSRKNQK
jgi:hypothetical protein